MQSLVQVRARKESDPGMQEQASKIWWSSATLRKIISSSSAMSNTLSDAAMMQDRCLIGGADNVAVIQGGWLICCGMVDGLRKYDTKEDRGVVKQVAWHRFV